MSLMDEYVATILSQQREAELAREIPRGRPVARARRRFSFGRNRPTPKPVVRPRTA